MNKMMSIESAQINKDASASLIEKVASLHEKLERVDCFVESIYGELYGYSPAECCEDDSNNQRLSLEKMVDQMHRRADKLRDCLDDTLMRLRG